MNILHFILLFIVIKSPSIIHIPFYRITPSSSNINPENFPSLYYETNYYSNITIGSNQQVIPMKLSFIYYHSFITIANYSQENLIKFDPDKSDTYEKTYGDRYFYNINIRKGINSKERFNLRTIDNRLIYCDHIDFILGTDLVKNISGELGMKLNTKEEEFNRLLNFSFVKNLHKNKYIKQAIFSINFINENNGEIIIGNTPDNYSNLDINTYKYTYAPSYANELFWGFNDLVSYLDKKRINIKKELAEFQIESNIITPVINYIQKINETFFSSLPTNKCIFVNDNNFFHFYHCDKDINLTNFPSINIYQKDIDYTFELNSNDLFEDIGNRKYFLVNFANNSETKWILGKPFLKKYNFTYNIAAKTVGLFFGTRNETEKEKEKEKNPKEEFNKVWIYVIISVFVIITLVIIIVIIVKKIPRKKRVIELEENFDYVENKNEENKEETKNENKENNGSDENQNALGIND